MITSMNDFLINESVNNELLYHGSKNKFSAFKLGSKVNNPTYSSSDFDHGLGIFLTDNLTMAEWFAGVSYYNMNFGAEKYEPTGDSGYVYSVKIDIDKPYIINHHHEIDEDDDDPGQKYFEVVKNFGGGRKFREYLIKNGYDSVILKNATTNYYQEGSFDIIVVLYPEDVKIIDVKEYGK